MGILVIKGFRSHIIKAAVIVLSGVVTASATVAADGFGPVKAPKVNAKKAELGKRLFFDQRLSGDAAISCATCHVPSKGFSDGLALSKAYPGSDGFRNTPTLINAAQKAAWF
ncbi:MAG: cytochrome-c peroxidase, partial [Rhodospirillales bacterium]|nr:cytochrome-c peroxidase [Rhodospirillales bacterium]